MPISHELDQSLGRSITEVVLSTAERVNIRRASVGLPSVDGNELAGRTQLFVVENNRGSLMWNLPSLKRDRARLKALNPTVEVYAALCEDGRLDRPTRGPVSSTKTEHGHVGLKFVQSKGIWIPKGESIQRSLEDPTKHPLNINKIHNHKCAAWGLTLQNLRSEVWNYVTPEQKTHVLSISQKDPVLGNMVFAELTNTQAYDAYYEDVHGVRRRTAVTMVTDPHTTGIELITPLVNRDRKGNIIGLTKPEDMKRFNTTTFVQAVSELLEQSDDLNIPEVGKYKDDYFDPDKFPKFFQELTDLTVATSLGRVEKEDGSVWVVPEALMDIKRRYIDRFIEEGYQDLAPDSREALKHHTTYAAWREYLLIGQSKTKEHQEVLASGSDDGSNMLKYVPWEQSIRYSIPVGSRDGITRFLVAKAVMDSTKINNGNPHLSFIVSGESLRVRELFDLIVEDPEVSETISIGSMFPIAGILDSAGMFKGVVPETVRAI